VQLCHKQDAEDALQDTFMRYIAKAPAFREGEHEKAWLITVALNICRDMRRFSGRHRHENLDDLTGYAETKENTGILETVAALPPKYKSVILLHYIEGYGTAEIAEILRLTVPAVKKRLQRGREQLKLEIEKERLL
jgi:RNA polymerase sigma-70 factor (ECF subfamily)